MQVSYSRPSNPTVTVVGSSSGASLLTDPAALTNGRPADATRLQWLAASSGTPLNDYVEIQLMWTNAQAFVPNVVGLFGLNILSLASSAGLKMTIMGHRVADAAGTFPYALGGNTGLVRSVTCSDKSSKAVALTDNGVLGTALTPVSGLAFRIYNDVSGVASIPAGSYLDLGDLWGGQGFDVDIEADWDLTKPDNGPSGGTGGDSVNDQPWKNLYPPGRQLIVSKTLIPFTAAYIDGTNPSYQTLQYLIGEGDPSVQIPRWSDEFGTLDVPSVHATAIFGTSKKFVGLKRTVGEKFSTGWTQYEYPQLAA